MNTDSRLTVSQIMAMTGKSRPAVRFWIVEKGLKATKTFDGYRIDQADWDVWIKANMPWIRSNRSKA